MRFLPNTIYHINQKDPINPDYIIDYGCAVCAAGQAAAYYAEKQYTVSDCKEAGLYSEGSASCSWNWNTNKSTNVSVGSTYTEVNSTDVNYATIRDEIDNGHPPDNLFDLWRTYALGYGLCLYLSRRYHK